MNDEKLIFLVRKNELIYNKCLLDYKNAEKKRFVWRRIAKDMGLPGDICIRRWTSLRDRYTKEKREENLPSFKGSVHKPRWPLLEKMEFLAPHIVPRPKRYAKQFLDRVKNSPPSQYSQSSVDIFDTYEEESYAASEMLHMFSEDISSSPSERMLPSPTPITTTSFQKSYTSSLKSIDPETSLSTNSKEQPQISHSEKTGCGKRKSSDQDFDEIFLDAVVSFKKICRDKEEKMKQRESDPLYGFGKMVVAIMSALSARKQEKAIQQVTNLLMQIKSEPEED